MPADRRAAGLALAVALAVSAAASAPGPVAAAPPTVATGAPGGDAPALAQRRRRGVRPGYRRMRARWHARASAAERREWHRADPRPLELRPVVSGGRFVLRPVDEEGRFDAPEPLAIAREAFAYRGDGSTTDVHPRLLALVYRAVLRFEVPYVHVVSGYRPTRATSRHSQGRAIDLVLPGVSDRGLAAYLRRQGFVGVGLYPLSGFVHLDVRAQSYFWVDRSPPGGRQRRRRILPELGWKMDAEARRRGAVPVPDVGAELALDEAPEAIDGCRGRDRPRWWAPRPPPEADEAPPPP